MKQAAQFFLFWCGWQEQTVAKVCSGLRLSLFYRLPLLSLFVSFCLWDGSVTAIMPIKALELSWLCLDIPSTRRFRNR